MKVSYLTLAASFAFIAGCSPGPVPVSQSPRDPSNPAAAEGVAVAQPTVRAASSVPSASAADQHAGHHHGGGPAIAPATSVASANSDAGAVATVYTCPMHPQITSPAPSRCPLCGMNLVPKK